MPAYWVARSKINDPVEYKKYTDRVPAIIAKYGGQVLARGGKFQVMEGPRKFQRFVVIEFPSFEQGVACFTSKEYNEAAAFRRANGAGEVETIMVEGGEATKGVRRRTKYGLLNTQPMSAVGGKAEIVRTSPCPPLTQSGYRPAAGESGDGSLN